MVTYKRPGVFVEEVSTTPRTVEQVATAIPAFIGQTEKGPPLARVGSISEYLTLFGGAQATGFSVTTRTDRATGAVTLDKVTPDVDPDGLPACLMYDSLRHYFENGGGPCYVIPTGHYATALSKAGFDAALARLAQEDEPTLIVLTDAVKLSAPDYQAVCRQALAQCATLGDRFAILDVRDGDVSAFRAGIGNAALMYGAAYHPYLVTSLNYQYRDADVQVRLTGEKGVIQDLAALRQVNAGLYKQIKLALDEQWLTLPPSAALAGIYARVDAARGVWKAPANVSVASVIEPVIVIGDAEQEGLNVDPVAGKSINAIRTFPSKGTRVWGARTLAGNDNEWRYVPVRRTLIMLEASIQQSTAFAVFEPNDANTWLMVKTMLDNYLYDLWRQGALMGSSPQEAYFVRVGLGKTMTADDIKMGRLIMEIGVAPVRPAEFIVLRISQKMQAA